MWLTVLLSSVTIITITNAAMCLYNDVSKHDLVCLPGETDSILERGLIPNNDEITSVSMKACRITEATCDAFVGVPAVHHLDLAENKIKHLLACVFESMPQLVTLNLSYNFIEELPHGIFSNKDNIETIDLKGNKIKRIPDGIFDNMPKLSKVDLSNNEIGGDDLKSSAFQSNQRIAYLDLSRNALIGAPNDLLSEFRNLQFLYLNRCFLTDIPLFATSVNLKTLKHLVMSTNQITSLDDSNVFKNFDNLELINLAENAIESIADNVFSPMRKLKTVVLKYNRLKVVPEKLFQNMPKLVNIDLSYNIIDNVQVNMFRNTPAKNLNLSGNKLTYLPQNFYREMINSGGKLKKFLFSNNPWQCACLLEILEDMKANNVEYNSEHFNGNEAVCVSSKHFTFTCNRD